MVKVGDERGLNYITDGLGFVYHQESGNLIQTLRGHQEGSSVNCAAWCDKSSDSDAQIDGLLALACDDCTVSIWTRRGFVRDE